jgi:colanic acid/amylovoran biosynthesis protein
MRHVERTTRRIEIQGTWLANAGARQMLRATTHALGDDGVELAIDPRWGARRRIADTGAVRIMPREMPGSELAEHALETVTRLAPRASARVFDARGLVDRRHLDGLVDASGFALSDQWGARKARQRRDSVRRYAVNGRPVVLLPQAMGPFSDSATADAAREVLEAATLVYVRDQASLVHARNLLGSAVDHLRRAPDITILDDGVAPDTTVADVVLVPNARLVDQGGWDKHVYLDALERCAAAATRRGRTVEVVCHTDEAGDRVLAAALAARLGCGVSAERDERRAKGRLAAAQLVVGSRFHALLGALSQGTPAVALGWSHKYGELLGDFSVQELAAPLGCDPVAAAGTVSDALDAVDELRARISARLPVLRAQVEDMWSMCREALGLAPVGASKSVR